MQALTDPFTGMILATMINLISPGTTVLSQVPIQFCDKECQESFLCDKKFHWSCKPPVFADDLYKSNLSHFDEETATLHSYTRPETYNEGLVRYAIMAEGIANISSKFSLKECQNKCLDAECKVACLQSSPWAGSRKDLAMLLTISANQESGFRGDVHGGTGKLGRGDCQWQTKDGKPASPFQKGAMPILETCKSVCVEQIKIGTSIMSGMTADDLVGVDLNSTENCLSMAAKHFIWSYTFCMKWKKHKGDWVSAVFSSYGVGNSCVVYKVKKENGQKLYAYQVGNEIVWASVPPDNAIVKEPIEESWPQKRTKMFYFFSKRNHQLNPETIARLESAEAQRVYEELKLPAKKYWMLPL